MFWITVNTFFAVLLLTLGIIELIARRNTPIGEDVGGAIYSLASIAAGCCLINISFYAIVQLAVGAVN